MFQHREARIVAQQNGTVPRVKAPLTTSVPFFHAHDLQQHLSKGTAELIICQYHATKPHRPHVRTEVHCPAIYESIVMLQGEWDKGDILSRIPHSFKLPYCSTHAPFLLRWSLQLILWNESGIQHKITFTVLQFHTSCNSVGIHRVAEVSKTCEYNTMSNKAMLLLRAQHTPVWWKTREKYHQTICTSKR